LLDREQSMRRCGARVNVVGYLDRLSAPAGASVACLISTTAPTVDVDVVRLIHGDTNPAGPGFRIEPVPAVPARTVPGRVQDVYPGSCLVADGFDPAPLRGVQVRVLMQPTLPSTDHEQGIVSLVDASGRSVLALVLTTDGRLAVRGATPGAPACELAITWRARQWYDVTVAIGATGDVQLRCRAMRNAGAGVAVSVAGHLDDGTWQGVVIGAAQCTRIDGQWRPDDCFNGKLENPQLATAAAAVADWRFELEMSSAHCVDVGPRAAHGTLVNSPTRACTGHTWTGRTLDAARAPAEYGAIHFHDDDLDDAGWAIDTVLDLPADLPSGVYAARLAATGELDYVPFVVSPGARPRARTLLLLPTFTYVAYANERMLDRLDFERDQLTDHPITPGRHDTELARHPEWGSSLYDLHPDGSGWCYSSHLRPVLNLRPDYRMWLQNAPRHLSADLYLIDWLRHEGIDFDVATDHDLNVDGPGLLSEYDVVLTGSHPEYVSEPILDALEAHLAAGGSLLYLGGNGFYWVTSQSPARPHILEVRRGPVGTRTSEVAPGEGQHSTTGEPGGLWRHRGRPPNALVGVGMTSQGWDAKAPGYRRMPDSLTPEAAFVFAGIGEDEIIGNFGLIMNGTSGDEIDRFDAELGSPEETLVLARSTGHSDYYQLVAEDVRAMRPNLGGSNCDLVRSDMTLLERSEGGAVFSVGSICFIGALSHNDYANNVSTLVRNVVTNFVGRPGKYRPSHARSTVSSRTSA
jgi:N,N-dimethylformamidase